MDTDRDVLRSSWAISMVRYKRWSSEDICPLHRPVPRLMSTSAQPVDTICLPTMPFNTPFAQPLESETDDLRVAEENLAFVTELLKRLEKEFKNIEVQEGKDKQSS
jgi:hypothetical protein